MHGRESTADFPSERQTLKVLLALLTQTRFCRLVGAALTMPDRRLVMIDCSAKSKAIFELSGNLMKVVCRRRPEMDSDPGNRSCRNLSFIFAR